MYQYANCYNVVTHNVDGAEEAGHKRKSDGRDAELPSSQKVAHLRLRVRPIREAVEHADRRAHHEERADHIVVAARQTVRASPVNRRKIMIVDRVRHQNKCLLGLRLINLKRSLNGSTHLEIYKTLIVIRQLLCYTRKMCLKFDNLLLNH